MNKITIIGGSGFVGTRLINELGADLCANIDKNQSLTYPKSTILHNILDTGLSQKMPKDVDTVVLLAAEHRDDVSPVSLYYDVNVEGTRNVLKAMDERGITKIIFTSSVAVYGLGKANPNENHPVDPFNHYGKSKFQAEQVLQEWYNKDPQNRSVVIIRPTVIFGERNRGNVYNLLKQIASGRFLLIGKGLNKKSMAYVGNIAALIHYFTDNISIGYNIFNYVDKPDLTMRELVSHVEKELQRKVLPIRLPYWFGYSAGMLFDIMAKLSGKKFSVSAVRVKKFCATTQFDAFKVLNMGFKPKYTLMDGLSRTLSYEFGDSTTKDDITFFTE